MLVFATSIRTKDGKAVRDQVFPIATDEPLPTGYESRRLVCARPTGEFRPPAKGEWYLSGGIVEAYRAPSTFAQAFHIATLVRGREVTVWEDA